MPFAKPYPESEYCTHISTEGRRCRALKLMTRDVCLYHWRKDGEFVDDEEALAQLANRWSGMTTTRGINRALAHLFQVTAQGKISHRRAALLTCQAQLMLHSLGRKAQPDEGPVDLPGNTNESLAEPHAAAPSAATAAQQAFSVQVVEAMEEVMEPIGAGIKTGAGSNGNGNGAHS